MKTILHRQHTQLLKSNMCIYYSIFNILPVSKLKANRQEGFVLYLNEAM
jgi:hypothetical protein